MPSEFTLADFEEQVPDAEELSARLNLPEVDLGGGMTGTVRSISVGTDKGHIVLPTIVGGKPVSNEEAISLWRQGKNKPLATGFATAADADAFSIAFHNAEAKRISRPSEFSLSDFEEEPALRPEIGELRQAVTPPDLGAVPFAMGGVNAPPAFQASIQPRIAPVVSPPEEFVPAIPRQPVSGELSTTFGGPRKPLASYAETMESLQEAGTPISRIVAPRPVITEPRIDIPDVPIPKEAGFWNAAGREAVNAAASVPEFLSSDAGILAAMSAKLAPRLTSAGFSIDLFHSAFEQAKNLYKNWGKMTPAERGKASVDTLASLVLGGTTGAHAAGVKLTTRAKPVEEAKPEVAEVVPSKPTEAPADVTSRLETAIRNPEELKKGNALSSTLGLEVKSIEDLENLAKLHEKIAKENRALLDELQTLPPEERGPRSVELFSAALRNQLVRETAGVATDTAWVEGEGTIPTKLGPRPLDWKTNPEVADWLLKNADRLDLKLPDALKARAAKPAAVETAVAKANRPSVKLMPDAKGNIQKLPAELKPDGTWETHDEIIARNGLKTEDIDRRMFVDEQGNEKPREQTAQELSAAGVETKVPGEAHSTDLPPAKPTEVSPTEAQLPNQPWPELTPEQKAKERNQARRLVEERYRFATPEVLKQKLEEFDAQYPEPKPPEPAPAAPTPPTPPTPTAKPTPAPAAEKKVARQVQKVAVTKGQIPAKAVKEEYVRRVESELDDIVSKQGWTVTQNPTYPQRWELKSKDGNQVNVDIEKSKSGFTGTAFGLPGGKKTITGKTIDEVLYDAKAYASSEKGSVTINIPGDGDVTIFKNGSALIEVRDRASRLKTTPQKVSAPTSGEKTTFREDAEAAARAYGSPEAAYRSVKRQHDALQAQEPPSNREDRATWNEQIQGSESLMAELFGQTKAGKLSAQAEGARDAVENYRAGAKGFEEAIAKIEKIKRKTQAHKDRLADLKERYAQNQEFIRSNEKKAEAWEQEAAKEKAALESVQPTPPPGTQGLGAAPTRPIETRLSTSNIAKTKEEKAFRATAEGQRAMQSRASRIGTLLQMNEAIRKIDPNEAYDRSLIESIPDSQIDTWMEDLRQNWNKLKAAQPDHGIGGAAIRARKWTDATDPNSEKGFVSLHVLEPLLRPLIDRTSPYVKSVVDTIMAVGKHQFDIGKATDFRRSVFHWSAKLQRSFGEAASAQKEIRTKVPDKTRREGITNWIQAAGDRVVLAQRRADTEAWRDPVTGKPHPQQKQLLAGYDAALHLTPEEIAVAQDVKRTYDELGNRGQTYDVLKTFKDNYVTQIWNLRRGPIPKGAGVGRSLMLKDRFRFAKASTFDTFFDGEQAGYVPRTKDISDILPLYMHEMNSVIAARQLVEQMAGGVGSDGRKLLAPRGVGMAVEGDRGKATLVMPDVPAEKTRDYVIIENQPALHEWRWVTKDAAGNPVFNKSDLMVHPEVADHFRNVLGRSAIKEWYRSRTTASAEIPKFIARALDFAQSETKRTMLGVLTPFHQVQEGTHAVGHRVNPFFNNPKIDLVNDAGQMDAAKHGLMLLPDRTSSQQFMEGFKQSALVTKIPVLGPLADHYSEYLFHQYIPGIKYKTYQAILQRNTHLYGRELTAGRATLEDIKILSAEQANAAYGHLNYADLGRNPTILHIMRLGLLAPDFLEARARFAGQAIKGIGGAKIGREQLVALATLALAQSSLSYIMANITGGTWDEKDPFAFHVGNKKFTMRSVPEDAYRFAKDTRSFVYARLNPIIGRGAVQYASGVDWRGQKVTKARTTKELLTQPVPLFLRPLVGLGNTPLMAWEEIAAASGLKISRYSAVSEMYKVAHQWKADNPDPKVQRAEARYEASSFPDSDYKPLRESLIKNDMKGAMTAYEELLKTGHPHKDIDNVMKPWTGGTVNKATGELTPRHPKAFTSAKLESRFVQSLTDEQRATYNRAIIERRELYARFQQMLSQQQPKQKPTSEFSLKDFE